MRPVHIAGIGELPHLLRDTAHDEAELVQAVVSEALRDAGMHRHDVGFWCSGSNDYVMGKPFSFTMAMDGIGAWPPVRESHVEMDGAWALYEAWVRLQHGDVDVAVVYAFGKSSLCDVSAVRTLELDPYTLAPLGVPPVALAALQARCLIDAELATEDDFASVVDRTRAAARDNVRVPDPSPDGGLFACAPLRHRDCAVGTDGAAAIVLSVGGPGPRIAGISHCIDAHQPGQRELTVSASAAAAARGAGLGRVDVAELHAPYSSQEGVLIRALGLDSGVAISPSGGALAAETPMVVGLARFTAAARAVRAGASAALAHATSGPCLQHNLVAVLEAS